MKHGVVLPDEVISKIRAAASIVDHGTITIYLDATRNTVDIEVSSRERIELCKTPM